MTLEKKIYHYLINPMDIIDQVGSKVGIKKKKVIQNSAPMPSRMSGTL